jgi:pimeloyl-ACP methyl ester carboxylesterase
MIVLLLPGFMTDADLWGDVVEALDVFGPILHGALGGGGTVTEMAHQVATATPPHFVLIGFSMGGYVAREVARLLPGRVRALVLIATSARGDTPGQMRRKREAAASSGAGRLRGLSRATIAAALHPARAGDEALIERLRRMGERLGPDVLRRQAGAPRESDRDRLRAIACPTLVVAAAADPLRSLEEARELRDGIPGAVLEVIEGSGHMLPLEAPEALLAVILPWLRGVLGD